MGPRSHHLRRLRPGRVLACAALGLITVAAPTATAGTPTILGNVSQGKGTVTAGTNGTFHVVYNDEGSKLITYCQVTSATLKPTGVGCAKRTLVPFSGTTGEAYPEVPWIVRDPASGTLYLAMQNYLIDTPQTVTNHAWVWTSTDDGTTFTGPVQIHQRGTGTDPSRPLLGPKPGTLGFASSNTALFAFSAAIDGSGATDESASTLDTGGVPNFNFSGGTRIAPFGARTIAASDTAENVYSWSTGPNADLGNQASWSPPTIVDGGSDVTIAGGENSTFMTYNRKSDGRLVAREWSGSEWGDATIVNPNEAATTTYLDDAYMSPGGKLVVGYRENGTGLRVSTSDDGQRWETRTIAVSDEIFFDLNVARDDAGNGLAVWTRSGAIVAASTTAVRDATAPRRTVSVTKDGFTTGLNLEGSCVLPGAKTTLTVGGQGTGQVTKVVFGLGKAKVTDTKKPYTATLTVPASSAAGASLPAKATITHRFKKKGKTLTKQRTITTALDVCG
ncbi:MAG: sialidase family protein [Solirubrobacteraceae bacterium]|nr:sialidase family protein [Solirubrobacteraceae bacterium]